MAKEIQESHPVEPKNSKAQVSKIKGSDGDNKSLDDKRVTLFEYLKGLYEGKTLNKSYKKEFRRIDLSSKLSDEQKIDLTNLALEKDKDYKTLLAIAEFMIGFRGSISVRDAVMDFIECVVSNVGNLAKTNTSTVLHTWNSQGENETSDRFRFMSDQIDKITDGVDKKGNPKSLTNGRSNVLKCVCVIWLFYKDHNTTLEQSVSSLSKEMFGVEGVDKATIEGKALGFMTSMVISSNRDKFICFLDQLLRQKNALALELNDQRVRTSYLSREGKRLGEEVLELKNDLVEKETKVEELSHQVSGLLDELDQTKEHASHQGIHQRDELKALKGKILNFLEQDIAPLIRSGIAANSRRPPKTKVVDIKLEDALQQLEEQITWLKQ